MAIEIVIISDTEMEQLTPLDKDQSLGAMLTDKGPLPLQSVDAQARLEGLIADVTLTQTFVNRHAEPLEATYIFPLPDRAAVTSFRMEVAGRVVEGVLKERSEARREYDEALAAGHRAAITEEERPGVFTIRVGNIPAGETATVRLTMVGPLVYEGGEVTFRFPLVVAPRYIPGNPLEGRSVGDGAVHDTDAVPDASRITPPVLLPGYPFPVGFAMSIDVLPAGLPVRDFRSSLHAIATDQQADGATRITIQPGERLNRDVVLRYQIGEETITTSLTLVPDADSREGTFVLTVVPPVRADGRLPKADNRARDVVFVLDRSGSMEGWKMIAARRALGRMIDTLSERDRFSVLAFDDVLEVPALCDRELATASNRNRYRIIEWLAKIDARGGTEMAQPLQYAMTQLATDNQRERVLVLLTDGQVGNEDQILQALGTRAKGVRIFTLGIDQAVNEAFLRRLAALGGGSCDVVESENRLDEVMEKVQRRIGTPLWMGLKIEASELALEANSQVPGRLPDLYPNVPLTVFGRFRGKPQGKVVFNATDDVGRQVTQTAEARLSSNPAFAKVWARGRLRDLEDAWVIVGHEEPDPFQQEIVALSLRFGVLCRFTAFVAVDRAETVNQGGKLQHVVQPVELPQGWQMPAASAYAVGSMLSRKARSFGKLLAGGPPMMASAMAPASSDQDSMCDFDAAELTGERNECETNGGPYAEAVEESAPEIDLDAYRQRAREMLQDLQTDNDIVHALGVLRLKLEALVEDLKSIGAGDDVIEPLARLLEELASGAANPGDAAINATQVLEMFAGMDE